MAQIAISYRRDDSLDVTGRIFDRLSGHFGREAVFRDIDNIPRVSIFGATSRWAIEVGLAAMLGVIGAGGWWVFVEQPAEMARLYQVRD
jgi:hypothetical protein